MSDLAHDRIEQLCDDLKLPGVLDAYSTLAAAAAEEDIALPIFSRMRFVQSEIFDGRVRLRP